MMLFIHSVSFCLAGISFGGGVGVGDFDSDSIS